MLIRGDCLEELRKIPDNSIDSLVTDPPAGISFMGKAWDGDKGGRAGWVAWMTEVMSECLRVLKPGAHGLVWAIPRTSHWTASALEDAGFEIRDVITHLFGQGFPKSLDISKAIDKAAGAERDVIGSYKATGTARRKGGIGAETSSSIGGYEAVNDSINITAPSTDAAKQWSGWGTALKPASEHWILVRKPVSEKNVAANVLKWGTGGVNVDGCRVETSETLGRLNHTSSTFNAKNTTPYVDNSKGLGRFPANLVLSHSTHCTDDQCDIECAIRALDEQAEQTASRFFYCAKISPSERNAGLAEMPKVNANVGDHRPSGNMSQRLHGKENRPDIPRANHHPTVKPQKLMRYLCRLITPPGGTVLDPFMGSGSTGMAARDEGFAFVGIEREPDYYTIAEKRIAQVEARA